MLGNNYNLIGFFYFSCFIQFKYCIQHYSLSVYNIDSVLTSESSTYTCFIFLCVCVSVFLFFHLFKFLYTYLLRITDLIHHQLFVFFIKALSKLKLCQKKGLDWSDRLRFVFFFWNNGKFIKSTIKVTWVQFQI